MCKKKQKEQPEENIRVVYGYIAANEYSSNRKLVLMRADFSKIRELNSPELAEALKNMAVDYLRDVEKTISSGARHEDFKDCSLCHTGELDLVYKQAANPPQ